MAEMNDRRREKELLDLLPERLNPAVMTDLCELLSLRLERYKNLLISTSDDLTRGRAQEARDLLEKLDKKIASTS